MAFAAEREPCRRKIAIMASPRFRFMLVAAFIALAAVARSQPPAPALPDPRLSESQNQTMDELAQEALDAAGRILLAHPPGIPEPPERRAALLLIDGVMHDPAAAERRRVKEFHKAQLEGAANELETTRVEKGARVWKLYGRGFIVRTASATLAFDVVQAGGVKAKEFAPWGDVYGRMAEQSDALFVSSGDERCADAQVAEKFVKLGKLVIAPKGLWDDKPFGANILRMEANPPEWQEVQFGAGKRMEVFAHPAGGGLAYRIKGADGLEIAHVGQPISEADWAAIEGASARGSVDLLMPLCSSPDLPRLAKGFAAKTIIPCGENELAGEIDAREPYSRDYRRLRLLGVPFVVMAWGEAVQITP